MNKEEVDKRPNLNTVVELTSGVGERVILGVPVSNTTQISMVSPSISTNECVIVPIALVSVGFQVHLKSSSVSVLDSR